MIVNNAPVKIFQTRNNLLSISLIIMQFVIDANAKTMESVNQLEPPVLAHLSVHLVTLCVLMVIALLDPTTLRNVLTGV
jgi:hypothetical protein